MRKVAVLAIAMIAVAGFAFGNSITVPFFLDDGEGLFATQGNASGFIGLVNTSQGDIELSVIYVSPTGPGNSPENRTPAANTFLITANGTVSFRPGVREVNSEGDNSVPNMTGFVDITANGWSQAAVIQAGTAIFYWDSGDGDERSIKGRYVQNNSNGSSFSYFLGEGRTN